MNIESLSLKNLLLFREVSQPGTELRQKAELEIIARAKEFKEVSLEFIYSVCKVGKRPLNLYFRPDTPSYQLYGTEVIIDMYLDNDQKEILDNQYKSKPPVRTYGNFKATPLNVDNLNQQQITDLRSIGINTSDILGCEY